MNGVALTCLVVVFAFLLGAASAVRASEKVDGLESRSDRPYVHNLSLYTSDGSSINPASPHPAPFSTSATCAKCHDVKAVSGGWHFNAHDPEVDHGRRGEPWVLVDSGAATQIPISYRGWPGTWHPDSLGLSSAEFVKLFGRHHPGGSIGIGKGRSADDTKGWDQTGDLEIDCMICHDTSAEYDPLRRMEQLELGNFPHLPAVAMGIGRAKGSLRDSGATKSALEDFAAFDPAAEEGSVKSIVEFLYDMDRFDGDGRVLFELTAKVPSTNCLYCHTHRITESPEKVPQWQHTGDVHLTAGLSCVDCHRNGIDHHIVRGFEGETLPSGLSSEPFTCRGCHLGTGATHRLEVTQTAGGLGSPIPGHRGIPPVHFEKMSCTSCHSGPRPAQEVSIVQTSMAHALGLPRFGRLSLEMPHIVEPVFLPDAHGRLAPHRLIWPAFFAEPSQDGKVYTPIMPARVRELLSIAEPDPILERTEEGLVEVLKKLKTGGIPGVVYIADGIVHRIGEDGKLQGVAEDAAQPYSWPIAHDVRPAGQSFGASSCQECHAPDSPFLFGSVTAPLVLHRAGPIVYAAMEFSRFDALYHSTLARSFAARTAFKTLMLAAVIVMGLVLIASFLRFLSPRRGSS